MKLCSYYYLAYPDCSPADPLVAASEVYVEVAREDGSIENFDSTYAVTVCTVGFLRDHLRKHPNYAARSLIVVDRFEDAMIREALEAQLPNLEAFAIKK